MNAPVGQITEVADNNLFFFSRARMRELAESLRRNFVEAKPYPHVVIDDFLPLDIALRIGRSFPGIDDINWKLEGAGDTQHSNDKRIEKVSSADEETFPPAIRHMMSQFQSGIFCEFLSRLTGYSHLQPDPSHWGCGMHSTGNGGRGMLHIDASRHPNKDLNQIVNVIYYCTPGWEDSYGGALELWNEDATKCVAKVSPRFNRMIIFYIAGKSWHGHPYPITCPPAMRRNSLALYYYTTDKTASGVEYSNFVRWKHVTKYDKKQPIHYAKEIIRATLPTPAINVLATIARKTGLNMKGGAMKKGAMTKK